MPTERWRKALLPVDSSLQQAIRCLDQSALQIAIVTAQDGRMVGKGDVKIQNVRTNVSAALRGWDVGLQPLDTVRYAVWFCRLCLGELNLNTAKFTATARNA